MKAKFLFFIFFLILISSRSFCHDSGYLISEMEKLRDSLPLDDPSRIDLTYRLADLYFDASIKEGKVADHSLLKRSRLRALSLYRHGLEGTNGVKKAEGLTRVKIQFQMARVLGRLDEHSKAEAYYLNVDKSPLTPKRMREQASLALAEWYEEDTKYALSKKYYKRAISLCSVRSTCNYAHYRKAWLHFKDTDLERAISEMKLSLWVDDDEIRESSLQDLIIFMSNKETDGLEELDYIKKIAVKLKREELVGKLVEAFFVAGNRRAGSNLLAYVNSQNPSLYFEVRLLEEFYGFRNWEKVEFFLSSLSKRSDADIPKKVEHAKEVSKILKRYLVQVDAESNVAPKLKSFLKRSIDVYLGIYPNDDLRKKLQQAWIKAEDDERKIMLRLGRWIDEDLSFGLDKAEVRKLRQTRLSLAQKVKNSEIIILESLALAKTLEGKEEADEFKYVAAHEYYTQKKYELALPIFMNLLELAEQRKKINKWSLLSQNLVLDIYNGKGDYQKIIDQVAFWKSLTKNNEDKKIIKENGVMSKLQLDARFALAAKMDDKIRSLEEFYGFCFSGVYVQKSCPNAKVLAVELGDQKKLVKLLEKEGDEKSLMNEYEFMGRFSDAARLQEKIKLRSFKGRPPYELYLKLALLYELDQNLKQRDRILGMMIKRFKKEKLIPAKLENVIFLTLDEAGMINSRALFFPWSVEKKLELASRLEIENSSKKTRDIILKEKTAKGPIWSRLILEKLQRSFTKIGKISFYGRYSKSRFKRRTRAIKRFVELSKPYLDGADLETRVYLLHMLVRTYKKMADDILKTPLPPDLDAETMAQVNSQLKDMAGPFEKVKLDYEKLLNEQIVQLEEEDLKRVAQNLEGEIERYDRFIVIESPKKEEKIKIDLLAIKDLRSRLETNPNDRESMRELRDFYKTRREGRLAAYFSGRLESLEN